MKHVMTKFPYNGPPSTNLTNFPPFEGWKRKQRNQQSNGMIGIGKYVAIYMLFLVVLISLLQNPGGSLRNVSGLLKFLASYF